ncbi:MAG: catalase [Clostridia bacterium]|nr:catalase [Clostridia bacterium]
MNLTARFFGHLKTVTRHRHLVFCGCVRAGIPLQGLLHDLSKFSPTEFLPGVRFYDGHHSPTEDERRLSGYSRAWMHHKGRNKHHWEYWTDYYSAQGQYEPVPMPRRYLAEMVCDRMAASKVYKGAEYSDACPVEYLLKGKMRKLMHPQTLDELTHFLSLLRDEGEDRMFAALRAWVREKP